MKFLNQFLISGHSFSENENLIKFRFSFLNSLLVVSIIATSMTFLASFLGIVNTNIIFQQMMFIFIVINIFLIYFLRKNKKYLSLAVHIVIGSGLILFYFALFTVRIDEFRLIWFFVALFAVFIFMGKIYGLIVAILIMLSILLINKYATIEYSDPAIGTFTIAFLVFTAFAYFFLGKIEKDAVEFTILNDKLKEKVSQEVQQRQEQEKMLLHQCRMASMGEMIDSIAHQWRQPLMNINAILMNMDRAIETKNKTPQYMENKMDEIINLTTHMSQTIEDFRSLFVTDRAKFSFDVNASIHHALSIFKEPLKEIKLTFNDKKKIMHYGHDNEFIQVIIILISNAIEILDIRNIEKKTLHIHVSKDTKHLTMSVQDNAGGIREENIPHIFDPYFSTKKGTGGTGLGLYVAKIIIEQNMQGTLSASNTNEGAKFEITIPKG